MIPIPPDRLAPEVLDALVEEFVTRHGTDLTDADRKVEQVRAQLRTGEIIIVWDERTESANIVPKDAKEESPPPHAAEAREPEPARDDFVPPLPPPPTRPPRHRAGPVDEDGRHIVFDEPAAPDPTDY